jgi:hypothetical protein
MTPLVNKQLLNKLRVITPNGQQALIVEEVMPNIPQEDLKKRGSHMKYAQYKLKFDDGQTQVVRLGKDYQVANPEVLKEVK